MADADEERRVTPDHPQVFQLAFDGALYAWDGTENFVWCEQCGGYHRLADVALLGIPEAR